MNLDDMLYEAVKRLCEHVTERHGAITWHDERWAEEGKVEIPGYYSPKGVMVDAEHIANLMMVMSVMDKAGHP